LHDASFGIWSLKFLWRLVPGAFLSELAAAHPVAGNFRFPPASAILVMFFCDVFLLHSG
jgi:hypothetical protein